jgi:hypothetical protein
MSKLFAIPFGTDGTDGDSSWHPETLNCDKSDTFASLKAKLLAATNDQDSPFAGLADDMGDEGCTMDELAGFWIIDQKTKRMIDSCDMSDIGCDSALYRHISAVKRMVKAGAIKTILKPKG